MQGQARGATRRLEQRRIAFVSLCVPSLNPSSGPTSLVISGLSYIIHFSLSLSPSFGASLVAAVNTLALNFQELFRLRTSAEVQHTLEPYF